MNLRIKIFLKSMNLKKIFFKKHDFEEKKTFLKSRFWKFFCTHKVMFWFILPRKMRKFYVLRAYLKSTILNEKLLLKSMILKKKYSLKSMILKEKVCVKCMFFN